MRVTFFGTGDFAVPALRKLVGAGHDVCCAVSQPDRPAGRGRQVASTPVHAAAVELGIPHDQTSDVNALDANTLARGADIGVVAAFGQKIGRAVLEAFPQGCVNIHGSLLPKYRGAAPFQWAILRGETTTGVTVFRLNERWDAGPVFGRRSLEIGPTETAAELHDRLALLGAELIVDVLARLERGEADGEVQDRSQVTRAPKLSRADAEVDWSTPAEEIVRRIHGLWSWPAATSVFASRSGRSERLLLARAEVADEASVPTAEFPAGAFRPDGAVQAGRGAVRLLEVRPAGKKLMSFEAFANGRQVGPGDRLLPVASA